MLKKIFDRILDIRRIIKRKNAQIRAEREKLAAAEVQNRIYASYILCLAANVGEARIKKSAIAEIVGKYRAEVSATADEYIINVREIGAEHGKIYSEKPVSSKAECKSAECHAEKAPDKTDGEGLEKD